MEYKRKKSKQYGDFVEIIFENEEEYQDLLEKYKSRIEYLEKCEYDSSSEKALVSSFERLKRVSNEGVITTAFFGNNCLDALYVANSGVYSNFYLNKNYCSLKELSQTEESVIQKLKQLNHLHKDTEKLYLNLIGTLCLISPLDLDVEFIENLPNSENTKPIYSALKEYFENGKFVEEELNRKIRELMEDEEIVKIMNDLESCFEDFKKRTEKLNKNYEEEESEYGSF